MFSPSRRSSRLLCLSLLKAVTGSILATTTLTVKEVTPDGTSNGSVAVQFFSDTAVAAAQMDVTFDASLYSTTAPTAEALPETFRLDAHLVEPGRLRLVVGGPNNPPIPNGTLFQVPLTATQSFSSSFPLRLGSILLSTAGSNPVSPQVAPSVGLSNLTDGQPVNGQNGVALSVETNATNGAVVRVEFYVNGSKVGQSSTSPFNFVWKPSASGTYVVYALAYDSNGLQTASKSISIVVSGLPGVTPTPTPTPNPLLKAQLANISTRLSVGNGENVLIGGFIITGNQPKKLIIRGTGPSLLATGLANALRDPTLELFDGAGSSLAANNNWQENGNAQQIIDSTVAPTSPLEAAILVTLNPGAYTAIVSGVNGTTGVGLVEVYDLDLGSDSKLANISTRGYVQTGDDVMIGGMIVVGNASQKLLIRAVGPSLANAGVRTPLNDPMIELFDSNGVMVNSNDNWKSAQEAEISATGLAPTNVAEAAIVTMLAPGAYTAIVRGAQNSTGIAVVEAYALP